MSTAATLRAFAIAQVGKRYILGANGPAAWDCSGLALATLNECGAGLPDMTAASLYNLTEAAEPAVGNLVFLRNNPARSNGIGHVAIITAKLSSGDWEIVEARGHVAGVVRTTLSYWRTRKYYTGVRHLKGFALEKAVPTVPAIGVPAALEVDGDPGKLTYDALQWALGVERTGALDKATRTAFRSWLGVAPGSEIDATATKRLQWWVDETADGQLGPKTSKGLQRFLNAMIAGAQGDPGTGAFRVATANLQGYDGKQDDSGQAAKLRELVNASLYSLQETDAAKRAAVRAAHGPAFWTIPFGTVAIGVNLAKWKCPRPADVHRAPFNASGYTHGAVSATFERRANGGTVHFTAVHVRPQSIASGDDKIADVKAAADLTGHGGNRIIAGDFAMDPDPILTGWKRVTPDADTMDKLGDQHVDAILASGDVAWTPGEIKDPGALSDHRWAIGHGKVPAPASSL